MTTSPPEQPSVAAAEAPPAPKQSPEHWVLIEHKARNGPHSPDAERQLSKDCTALLGFNGKLDANFAMPLNRVLEIMNFMGIFVHKATPPAQIARLEAATRAAVANPAIAQRLVEAGTDPVGSSAADFNTFWQAQLALWLPVVEASGVKLE